MSSSVRWRIQGAFPCLPQRLAAPCPLHLACQPGGPPALADVACRPGEGRGGAAQDASAASAVRWSVAASNLRWRDLLVLEQKAQKQRQEEEEEEEKRRSQQEQEAAEGAPEQDADPAAEGKKGGGGRGVSAIGDLNEEPGGFCDLNEEPQEEDSGMDLEAPPREGGEAAPDEAPQEGAPAAGGEKNPAAAAYRGRTHSRAVGGGSGPEAHGIPMPSLVPPAAGDAGSGGAGGSIVEIDPWLLLEESAGAHGSNLWGSMIGGSGHGGGAYGANGLSWPSGSPAGLGSGGQGGPAAAPWLKGAVKLRKRSARFEMDGPDEPW